MARSSFFCWQNLWFWGFHGWVLYIPGRSWWCQAWWVCASEPPLCWLCQSCIAAVWSQTSSGQTKRSVAWASPVSERPTPPCVSQTLPHSTPPDVSTSNNSIGIWLNRLKSSKYVCLILLPFLLLQNNAVDFNIPKETSNQYGLAVYS